MRPYSKSRMFIQISLKIARWCNVPFLLGRFCLNLVYPFFLVNPTWAWFPFDFGWIMSAMFTWKIVFSLGDQVKVFCWTSSAGMIDALWLNFYRTKKNIIARKLTILSLAHYVDTCPPKRRKGGRSMYRTKAG